MSLLEEVWSDIQERVMLVPGQKSWHHTLCKVCNDHGKKGLRGGFKYDTDTLGYNCFNCNASFRLTAPEYIFSRDVSNVLIAFGFDQATIDSYKFRAVELRDQNGVGDSNQRTQAVKIKVPSVSLQQTFVALSSLKETDEFYITAKDHLQQKRRMDPSSYPFYICKDPENKKWFGRLIIPFYGKGRLIFYQGYDLFGIRQKKYLSPGVPKDSVLYGMERLHSYVDDPLFITEGFFDAFHCEGVAVVGKTLTEQQIHMLNASPRQKVIVPDKFGDGKRLAMLGLQQGWSISTPDIGNEKDITDAVVRFGKAYVLDTLYENICSGGLAQCALEVYNEDS